MNELKLLDEANLYRVPVKKISGRILQGPNDERWIDFCSTNYLSFDLNPEVILHANAFAEKWGPISGWSRFEADPEMYPNIENDIARHVGAKKTLISHTITLMGFSVIPHLAKDGVIFTDHKLHTVVWEACRLARDHGSQIERFAHQDLNHLEKLLQKHAHQKNKLIAVDGVYSISSALAPIKELQFLCEKYGAWLYIDDAHGYGVLGKNPTLENPYGVTGSGIVSHFGGNYDRTFYVSSFGKAFCTSTSFVTIPNQYEDNLPSYSLSHLFSAPPSPHTIGTVQAVLRLNEKIGETERLKLRQNSELFLSGIRELGFEVENHSSQPIFFIPLGELDDLIQGAKFLYSRGIFPGLRAFPVVPQNQCGVRFALSSAHTHEQIEKALQALSLIRRPQSRHIKKDSTYEQTQNI